MEIMMQKYRNLEEEKRAEKFWYFDYRLIFFSSSNLFLLFNKFLTFDRYQPKNIKIRIFDSNFLIFVKSHYESWAHFTYQCFFQRLVSMIEYFLY